MRCHVSIVVRSFTARPGSILSRCAVCMLFEQVCRADGDRARTGSRVRLVSSHQEHPDRGNGEAEHGQRGQTFP